MTDQPSEKTPVKEACTCSDPASIVADPAPKEDWKVEFDKLKADYASMSGQLEKLKTLESQLGVREKPQPTAQISNQSSGLTLEQHAKKLVEHIRDYGKYEITLPYNTLRNLAVKQVQTADGVRECYQSNANNVEMIKEAITLSGTHATQDLDRSVATVPGGISFKSVRQYAKFKDIMPGMDRARFFKKNLPASGTQTAGTTATAGSQTFTSIEVTPSTITGVYQPIGLGDIEDVPYDLVTEAVDSAAGLAIDFEATDMLDTVSKEGTLTPGKWIRGDTGAVITSSDIAGVAMDETGLFVAREYLEDQGYLRAGVKPVLFMDPQQWRELVTSTNVTSLATQSLPQMWLNASLESFAGLEIVVTNAIEHKANTTNAAQNAIAAVPLHSYGIGAKRDVTIKFHEVPEDNQVRTNVTWRIKSGVLDASSIVRISSTD